MKTIEERAIALVDDLYGETARTMNKRLVEKTILAFKEQLEITRHACAEVALYEYGHDIDASYTWDDLNEQRKVIHQAIMNTNAVK
jgi:hypothetical protein